MAYKRWRLSIFGTIIVIPSFFKNETRPLIRLRKERTNEMSQSPKLLSKNRVRTVLIFHGHLLALPEKKNTLSAKKQLC